MLVAMAVESVGSFEFLKDHNELRKNTEEHSNGGLEATQKSVALHPPAYRSVQTLILEIQQGMNAPEVLRAHRSKAVTQK